MAKPKFSAGMALITMVKEKISVALMFNNNTNTGHNLQHFKSIPFEFIYIPFEKIIPNDIINKNIEDDEQLYIAIIKHGLYRALSVHYNSGEDTYPLITGEKYYHAIDRMGPELRKQMFPKGIPCNVFERPSEERDENIRKAILNYIGKEKEK